MIVNQNEQSEQNKHKAKIIWESAGKNPAGEPFLSVKQARGYYYYAERGGRDSIAFILFDLNSEKIGLIYESKPPLDEVFGKKMMMVTAFGGSLDMDKTPEEICKIEVLEEAGYDVDLEKIICVGTTLVSTQMSQGCVGFFVDVTGLTPGKTEADIKNDVQDKKDPDEFIRNKVVWLNVDELMHNNDWKSIWIFSKIYHGAQSRDQHQ